ncbi:hypothetical protein ScPMuIL_016689 [Solemya velum]
MATGASQNRGIFGKKTCCAITGASRGLGKAIAIDFCTKFPPDCLFVLLSRDMNQLNSVKSEMETKSPRTTIVTKQFDQSNLDGRIYKSLFDDALRESRFGPGDFQQAMIIHNAGTGGDPSKYIRELSDPALVGGCFDTNISGMVLLNAAFLQTFPSSSVSSRVVVAMSSLSAIMPMRTWSLYCTVKAARDMFFRVLALEEPDIRVLNYAPGPCLTEMLSDLTRNTRDPERSKTLHAYFTEQTALEPAISIAKLVEILTENTFESGSHIDYYDRV